MTRTYSTLIRYIVPLVVAASVLAGSNLVYAQDAEVAVTAEVTTTSAQTEPAKPTSPLRLLNERVLNAREDAKAEYELKREMLKKELEIKREMVKGSVEERREGLKEAAMEKREQLQGISEEKRAELAERKADRVEKLENRAGDRLKTEYTRISERLTAAIARFENIASRIDERIAKLKADGVSVDSAVTLQAEAKVKIEAAKVAITAIPTTLPTLAEGEDAREVYKAAHLAVKEKVTAATTAIKEAHKALEAVVVELKRAGGEKADTETEASTE